jgi:hypothetical protein
MSKEPFIHKKSHFLLFVYLKNVRSLCYFMKCAFSFLRRHDKNKVGYCLLTIQNKADVWIGEKNFE